MDDKLKRARAEVCSRLLDKLDKLNVEDTSITIPPEWLTRTEARLRKLVDENVLDAYSAQLKAKRSGPLSFADLAIVACIHWVSVTTNGEKEQRFKGTSPFLRIARAPVAFKFRETQYDNRQIRYALAILEVVKFTEQKAAAVYTRDRKEENRAGVWTVSKLPAWVECFA